MTGNRVIVWSNAVIDIVIKSQQNTALQTVIKFIKIGCFVSIAPKKRGAENPLCTNSNQKPLKVIVKRMEKF